MAFMLVVESQVYTIKVADCLGEWKTADNLLRLLRQVFQTVSTEWGASVVAIVADAAGESYKACLDFAKEFPEIIVVDCYAHQLNLVVGDYFKSDATCLQYVDTVTNLITWLRGKSMLKSLLQQAQDTANLPWLTIIHAVLTCWTSHYQAFRCLLQVCVPLESVILLEEARPRDKKLIIIGKEAKDRAKKMIENIQNPLMWHAITRIVRHLEPLAIATNVVQKAFCSLDTVLLTFGFLWHCYNKMLYERDDRRRGTEADLGIAAILQSLEKCWAKADQEVFVAAIILNPFFQSSPFSQDNIFFNIAGITALLSKLWKCFYYEDAPTALSIQIQAYLQQQGMFQTIESECKTVQGVATGKGVRLNPLDVFTGYFFPGQEPIPLIKLARRVLSVCANSASCECLFSMFGDTLTKKRNQLATETLTSLVELKMHIWDEHLQNREDVQNCLKRNFGAYQNMQKERLSTSTAALASGTSTTTATSATAVTTTDKEDSTQSMENSMPGTSAFWEYIEHSMQMAAEDEDLDMDVDKDLSDC
uniref:HAT C-terminal dimerisation domain-containing protein n=1 Tax=Moniliophthora roreri TaxID=221103 RepID=A0A0W0F2I9_MONRR